MTLSEADDFRAETEALAALLAVPTTLIHTRPRSSRLDGQ